MKHTRAMRVRFAELMAEELSFAKISAEIGVSKPTLIKWAVEMEDEISTLKYMDRQALMEMHRLDPRSRVEESAIRLVKIREAIKGRDFGKEKLKDLAVMEERTERRLSADLEGIELHSGYTRAGIEARYGPRLINEKKLSLEMPDIDKKK